MSISSIEVSYSKYSKQKIHSKSFIESKLVGNSDYIPWTLFVKRILKSQGYSSKNNKFYQHNESTIGLKSNEGSHEVINQDTYLEVEFYLGCTKLKKLLN